MRIGSIGSAKGVTTPMPPPGMIPTPTSSMGHTAEPPLDHNVNSSANNSNNISSNVHDFHPQLPSTRNNTFQNHANSEADNDRLDKKNCESNIDNNTINNTANNNMDSFDIVSPTTYRDPENHHSSASNFNNHNLNSNDEPSNANKSKPNANRVTKPTPRDSPMAILPSNSKPVLSSATPINTTGSNVRNVQSPIRTDSHSTSLRKSRDLTTQNKDSEDDAYIVRSSPTMHYVVLKSSASHQHGSSNTNAQFSQKSAAGTPVIEPSPHSQQQQQHHHHHHILKDSMHKVRKAPMSVNGSPMSSLTPNNIMDMGDTPNSIGQNAIYTNRSQTIEDNASDTSDNALSSFVKANQIEELTNHGDFIDQDQANMRFQTSDNYLPNRRNTSLSTTPSSDTKFTHNPVLFNTDNNSPHTVNSPVINSRSSTIRGNKASVSKGTPRPRAITVGIFSGDTGKPKKLRANRVNSVPICSNQLKNGLSPRSGHTPFSDANDINANVSNHNISTQTLDLSHPKQNSDFHLRSPPKHGQERSPSTRSSPLSSFSAGGTPNSNKLQRNNTAGSTILATSNRQPMESQQSPTPSALLTSYSEGYDGAQSIKEDVISRPTNDFEKQLRQVQSLDFYSFHEGMSNDIFLGQLENCAFDDRFGALTGLSAPNNNSSDSADNKQSMAENLDRAALEPFKLLDDDQSFSASIEKG